MLINMSSQIEATLQFSAFSFNYYSKIFDIYNKSCKY